uniref:P2Y purinoceptor 1-like n=1 Tax=Semicossyphus pulcher TaxID=241346 RepID=UPI0037E89580
MISASVRSVTFTLKHTMLLSAAALTHMKRNPQAVKKWAGPLLVSLQSPHASDCHRCAHTSRLQQNQTGLKMSVNETRCDRIDLNFTHTVLPPVFGTVFVVGTLSNAWGLRSVCGSWNSIGHINVFMLNLGISDLLYLCTLPFLVDYYAGKSRWRFGPAFCKVTRFCFNLNLYGSIGFLTCISVSRYLGVVHPMRVMGKIHSRHSVGVSALVWTLVLVQILPDVLYFEKDDRTHPDSCFDTTSREMIQDYLPYSIAWTVTGFAVPLVVILLCYGHVVAVLARKESVNPVLKQRCLKLCVILVLLFSVCFIPYHVLRNLNLQTRILKENGICHETFRDVYLAHQVSRCLSCLNSAINPLIYIVGNDKFLLKMHNLSKRARLSLAGFTGAGRYRTPAEAESSESRVRSHPVNG